MINLKEVLTVSEAAEIYNLDVSTLRKLVKSNKLIEDIDFRKSKATWLFRKESLDKLYLNKKGTEKSVPLQVYNKHIKYIKINYRIIIS